MKNLIILLNILIVFYNQKCFGFTEDEINQILKTHNKYRIEVSENLAKNSDGSLLEKPIEPIPLLKYSKKLEYNAQEYANTCPKGHNPNNFKYKIGENLYWTTQTINSVNIILQGINNWASELTKCGFDFKKVGASRMPSGAFCQFGTNGHWTQIVWAKTKEVGCGYQNCENMNIVVCNYSPGGNVVGENVYETVKTKKKNWIKLKNHQQNIQNVYKTNSAQKYKIKFDNFKKSQFSNFNYPFNNIIQRFFQNFQQNY